MLESPELDFFKSACTHQQWSPTNWNITLEFPDPAHNRIVEHINRYVDAAGHPPPWEDLIRKYPSLQHTESFVLPMDLALANLNDQLFMDKARMLHVKQLAAIENDDHVAAAAAASEQYALWNLWEESHRMTEGLAPHESLISDPAFFNDDLAKPLWTPTCDALAYALDGGYRAGTMNIIAADTGVGKSMWLLARAVEAAEAGLKVLFMSFEMPKRECANRVYNMILGGPASDLDAAARQREIETWEEQTPGALAIVDGVDILPSTGQVRRALARFNLVCVDYAGLMTTDDGVPHAESHNTAEEIALTLLRGVQKFDGENNAHKAVLLVAAQLSKMAKPVRKFADVGYNVPHSAGTYAWGRSVHTFTTIHAKGLPPDLRLNAVEKHRSFVKVKPWYTRMSPTTGDFSHVPDERAREEIDAAEANDFDY